MRIVFDSSTIHQSSPARPITGVLYFEVAGHCFPDERWSDFPVIVTSWWLDGINNLQARPETEALFRFMDGPYFVRVQRVGGDLVNLRFVEDRRVQNALHEQSIPLLNLVSAVHALAADVAAACARGSLSCPELGDLKVYLPS
jgi:hypothetical protein